MAETKGTRQLPYIKQPAEELDYDFDFSKWFSQTAPTDTLPADTDQSYVIVSPTGGLQLGTKDHIGDVVKQWVSAGTNGILYKVTCRITTSEGRTREADMWIRVIDE